jgi:predicted Rossmann fold flavoprotein
MLLEECRQASVTIRLNCEIETVSHPVATWMGHKSGKPGTDTDFSHGGSPTEEVFYLDTNQGQLVSRHLVVATGGLSVPSLGGSGIGYELASCFGLRLLPRSAGLVPFTLTDGVRDVCGRLSGASTEVILYNGRQSFREDILFTHRGLSGPAALQLSSYWRPGESVSINLLPDHDAHELLIGWKQQHPRALLRSQLDQVMPRKLVLELQQLWWRDRAETALAEWSDASLESISHKLENWTLRPSGTEGYRTAEVTLGGVDTRDLSSRTMESVIPGLYFIGEVVDVTGDLGGFNFQWAWSSGFAAGQSV